MNKFLYKLFVFIFLVIVGIVGSFFAMTGPVKSDDTKLRVFTVSKGDTRDIVGANLKKADLIKSEFGFKIKCKMGGFDNKIKAGEYGISKSMSVDDILKIISSDKTYGRPFTIKEGMPIWKIKDALVLGKFCTAADFDKEVAEGEFKYEFLKYAPKDKTSIRLEGFLYPDTYSFGTKATAHDIIDTFLNNFDSKMDKDFFEKAKKKGLNPREALTMASIIEREAKTKSDKGKVASVIYNRLKIKMPLQMDSILSYIHKEDKIKASLKDTKVESTYNPYKNKGLPPGPICSPGKDSLNAVINPAKTKYLFFVASPMLDGTNVFSENYKDFLKDKAKFDKAYKEYIKKNPGVK